MTAAQARVINISKYQSRQSLKRDRSINLSSRAQPPARLLDLYFKISSWSNSFSGCNCCNRQQEFSPSGGLGVAFCWRIDLYCRQRAGKGTNWSYRISGASEPNASWDRLLPSYWPYVPSRIKQFSPEKVKELPALTGKSIGRGVKPRRHFHLWPKHRSHTRRLRLGFRK